MSKPWADQWWAPYVEAAAKNLRWYASGSWAASEFTLHRCMEESRMIKEMAAVFDVVADDAQADALAALQDEVTEMCKGVRWNPWSGD